MQQDSSRAGGDLPPVLTQLTMSHSEELQDIVSAVPSWIVRWGNTFYLLFFVTILFITWLIHYPVLIEVSAQLKAINAPKAVTSRVTGQLSSLLCEEGAYVRKGQELAVMENTADRKQMRELAQYLEMLHAALIQASPSAELPAITREFDQLGELQESYQLFAQTAEPYLDRQHFQQLRKDGVLKRPAVRHADTSPGPVTRLQAGKSRKQLPVRQTLSSYQDIAPSPGPEEVQPGIPAKHLLTRSKQSIINYQNSFTSPESYQPVGISGKTDAQRSALIQVLNILRNKVRLWEREYLLIAPISGHVYFTSFLEQQQNLTVNQKVFFIIPTSTTYFAEVALPLSSIRRAKIGQDVVLKINSYPFEEYGIVKGRLVYIAQIPDSNGLRARIDLPHGLVTTHNKTVEYHQGMQATADVITQDTRLIERIFSFFKRTTAY